MLGATHLTQAEIDLLTDLTARVEALEKHVGLTPEAPPAPPPLSAEEEAQLEALLARKRTSG